MSILCDQPAKFYRDKLHDKKNMEWNNEIIPKVHIWIMYPNEMFLCFEFFF